MTRKPIVLKLWRKIMNPFTQKLPKFSSALQSSYSFNMSKFLTSLIIIFIVILSNPYILMVLCEIGTLSLTCVGTSTTQSCSPTTAGYSKTLTGRAVLAILRWIWCGGWRARTWTFSNCSRRSAAYSTMTPAKYGESITTLKNVQIFYSKMRAEEMSIYWTCRPVQSRGTILGWKIGPNGWCSKWNNQLFILLKISKMKKIATIMISIIHQAQSKKIRN